MQEVDPSVRGAVRRRRRLTRRRIAAGSDDRQARPGVRITRHRVGRARRDLRRHGIVQRGRADRDHTVVRAGIIEGGRRLVAGRCDHDDVVGDRILDRVALDRIETAALSAAEAEIDDARAVLDGIVDRLSLIAGVGAGVGLIGKDLIDLQADVVAGTGEPRAVVGVGGRDSGDVGSVSVGVLGGAGAIGDRSADDLLAADHLVDAADRSEVGVRVVEAGVDDRDRDPRNRRARIRVGGRDDGHDLRRSGRVAPRVGCADPVHVPLLVGKEVRVVGRDRDRTRLIT